MAGPESQDVARRHRRLEVLVGRWTTHGRVRADGREDGAEINAVDTYAWLPGRCALLHRVDAELGDETVVGAEIIGYDPERGSYVTRYFGTDGPNAYEASLSDRGGALVWSMRSRRDRFTGAFSPDGDRITGHWEQRTDDAGWRPWMDVTLTRISSLGMRLTHTTVWVLEQDEALDFYTRRLGFEVNTDATLDGVRWLTVSSPSQPDHELILLEPGPPMMDEQTAAQVRTLVAKGVLGPGAFDVDDCAAAFAELRERGVTFLSEPAERPYGVEATLRDNSGNRFSMVERPGARATR